MIFSAYIDENYIVSSTSQGYYNSEFIYKYTGYWNEELYRLGVVYILPNGQLTPVFNIRGNTNVQKYGEITYSQYNIPDKVVYNESNYLVVSTKEAKNVQNENVKGVVRLKSNRDTNVIHGFDIRISKEAIQELKKYATGFFFVRQSRIPTILAQGVTMGVDQEAHVPCIATADGILTELGNNLNTTHVETSINDVNYVSEGFLSRYSFHFKKKSSGLFGKILKGIAAGVGVVAIAAACVFTAGAGAAVLAGASLSGAITAGSTAIGGILVAAGATATGLGATLGIAGASAVIAAGTGLAVGATLATL